MHPGASESSKLRGFLDALDGLDGMDVVKVFVTARPPRQRQRTIRFLSIGGRVCPLCRHSFGWWRGLGDLVGADWRAALRWPAAGEDLPGHPARTWLRLPARPHREDHLRAAQRPSRRRHRADRKLRDAPRLIGLRPLPRTPASALLRRRPNRRRPARGIRDAQVMGYPRSPPVARNDPRRAQCHPGGPDRRPRVMLGTAVRRTRPESVTIRDTSSRPSLSRMWRRRARAQSCDRAPRHDTTVVQTLEPLGESNDCTRRTRNGLRRSPALPERDSDATGYARADTTGRAYSRHVTRSFANNRGSPVVLFPTPLAAGRRGGWVDEPLQGRGEGGVADPLTPRRAAPRRL